MSSPLLLILIAIIAGLVYVLCGDPPSRTVRVGRLGEITFFACVLTLAWCALCHGAVSLR